jgi:hypothetical protein
MATYVGDKAEDRPVTAKPWKCLPASGWVAYGVVHLLVGWLALQIAWGLTRSDSADTSGP